MKSVPIQKLIAINIPISACNLKCQYCYISQLGKWDRIEQSLPSPELIEQALSVKRLGGPCIINLTGRGETLIPKETPEIIQRLLRQGHYLEVVTNGTLTSRFKTIASFAPELLEHLEFKFSFHYLELMKHNLLETFFDNVNLMRSVGCSFTIELMPSDDAIPFIDDIQQVCLDNVGALCHLTVGRDDTDNRKLLTSLTAEEYRKTWEVFDSKMFDFKYSVFGVRRREFCYAGMWTLYVDLATGKARQCYGFRADQNIYHNVNAPLYFRPAGRCCKSPFCFNAHAFMTLGVLPDIATPAYADIRDRIDDKGNHWLSEPVQAAFSAKLVDANRRLEGLERLFFYLSYPVHWARLVLANQDKIVSKVKFDKDD